mgnify:CR=1 FL=1
MSREERVVVRCTAAEKKLLGEVAFAMQRTLSDAVRILVHEKARDLDILIPMDEELDRLPNPVVRYRTGVSCDALRPSNSGVGSNTI